MLRLHGVAAVVGAVLILLAGGHAVQGQQAIDLAAGGHASAGYVAKPSEQLLGGGVAVLPPRLRGWGVLLDGRISTDGPSEGDIREDRDPQDALSDGHERFRNHRSWTTVSLSVMKGVTPQLALYLGGSASWRTVHTQFHYEDLVGDNRTERVFYWVEDGDEALVEAGVVGGALFQLRSRFLVQFGGQTAPSGFVLGGHLLVF